MLRHGWHLMETDPDPILHWEDTFANPQSAIERELKRIMMTETPPWRREQRQGPSGGGALMALLLIIIVAGYTTTMVLFPAHGDGTWKEEVAHPNSE